MERREFLRLTGLGLAALAVPRWARGAEEAPAKEVSAPSKIVWTFPSAKPVIRPGQLHGELDADSTAAAHVIEVGDNYRMYYWGRGKKGNVILMAEALKDHPNDWKPRGGLLLGAQPGSKYNPNGPGFPFVMPFTDQPWRMYFVGRRPPGGDTPQLALSDDAGLTWHYRNADSTPIFPLDQPYEKVVAGSSCVVKVGEEYRIYYTANSEVMDLPKSASSGHGKRIPHIGIGYAVSRDGLTWQKPFKDWIVTPRLFDAKPYEYINSKPYVIRDGNGWRMFISTFGTAYRVRSLVSEDGLKWTRVPSGPDGDLGAGAVGEFDDHQRSYACVIKTGEEYRLWYTGNGFGTGGIGYCTGRQSAA